MVHVGVDLDKRSSQIAVLSEDGEIVQHRLANDAARLEKFFADLPPHTPIAIEASGTWWWLVDLLEELGHQPVLSNPKQTKAIAAARLKNDRVDAERLALLLRGDLLPRVWIPPTALREARELIRHRIQLVWLRGVLRNRLQAMRERQTGRQLRRLDPARPRQCRSGSRRPHHQGRQSPAPVGLGPRRDASRPSARSSAGLVSCGEEAAGKESRAGRAGAPPRGDRV